MVTEFERKRLARVKDNTELSPVDILKAAIDDIERGELKCDGVVIVTALRPKDAPWEFDTYRAGMTRDQELVALVMAQERTIRHWLKG